MHVTRSNALSLLLLAAGCSADTNTHDDGADLLALDVPPGQVGMYAVASPAEGGSATVTVSFGGSTECSASECAGGLGSAVEFDATANDGYEFTGWSGCSYAGGGSSQASLTGFVGFQDETCTATFKQNTATQPTQPTQPSQPSVPSQISITLDVSALQGAGAGVILDKEPDDGDLRQTATYTHATQTFAGGKKGLYATFLVHLPSAGTPKLTSISGCPDSTISYMGKADGYLSYQVGILTEQDARCGIVTAAGVLVFADAVNTRTWPSIAADDFDQQCIIWGGSGQLGEYCIFKAGTTVTIAAAADNLDSMTCKGSPAVDSDGRALPDATRTFTSLTPGSTVECHASYKTQ